MNNATKPEYKNIDVTKPVSVEQVENAQRGSANILIMGPTGAGKSTFIEALGLKGIQRISSNKLEGFTQVVSTYQVNNVTRGDVLRGRQPIYLVDSPGFSDTKISEMTIISMVQKWLEDNNNQYFGRVLFLTPITHVRLPRSQRQVLKTFKTLTGFDTASQVTIVTTMWDAISGENATMRAQSTFLQLQNDVWKDFIQEGANFVKFLNTQDSALAILDDALKHTPNVLFSIEQEVNLLRAPFANNLRTDLQDRIQSLQSQHANLRLDLAQVDTQIDKELESVLLMQMDETEKDLFRFQGELHEFLNRSVDYWSESESENKYDDESTSDKEEDNDADESAFEDDESMDDEDWDALERTGREESSDDERSASDSHSQHSVQFQVPTVPAESPQTLLPGHSSVLFSANPVTPKPSVQVVSQPDVLMSHAAPEAPSAFTMIADSSQLEHRVVNRAPRGAIARTIHSIKHWGKTLGKRDKV